MIALAAALAAAAVWIGRSAPSAAGRLPRPGPTLLQLPRSAAPAGPVACALAGLAAALLVGLPAGAPVGLMVALLGPVLLARLEPAGARREREHLLRDLPLALDLLAACLAGGAAAASAAAAVGDALPGPCGRRLTGVHAAVMVGTAPDEAWLLLGGSDPDDPLAPTARLLARAAAGGTPVCAAVARLASEARAQSVAAGSYAARRVGVLVVAPLGLCFLPAFVLLGIVPVVAGLAGPLLQAL